MLEARLLTFDEMKIIYAKRLKELIKSAGNSNHLATMINVPTGTVKAWERRERISKEGAKLVENHPSLGKKFKADYLRPDLALIDEEAQIEEEYRAC